jgi:hypothetical protein
MSHSLFPLLISRENGGPLAQPAAPSLLFLFDAFNGEGLEIGCACRKSTPDIFVVQSAEDWAAKNRPCPLNSTR